MFERFLRSRAFCKNAPEVVLDSDESSSSDVHREDPIKLGAEELRAEAGCNAALILEVARKSGNLKSGFIKKLKDSAASLQSIVDALASRTEAEKTRRLRADNAADIKRDAVQETAPTYAQATHPVPPKNAAAVPKRVAPSKPAASVAPATPIAGPSNIPTTPEFQPREAQETSWSTVVKRGKKGKKASAPAVISAPVISAVTKTQAAKPKLTAPRTAAVIVTLQPEA
ncbi:translation initiation factor IF-2-like [Nymphalis io]|uniref:translation initiation factor IF-2-like n=1 Tax=Inachis io TaxID=171585 RepID=UPI002167D0A5|nr:translation initiation factor IF-2-like [Nymphalis io]